MRGKGSIVLFVVQSPNHHKSRFLGKQYNRKPTYLAKLRREEKKDEPCNWSGDIRKRFAFNNSTSSNPISNISKCSTISPSRPCHVLLLYAFSNSLDYRRQAISLQGSENWNKSHRDVRLITMKIFKKLPQTHNDQFKSSIHGQI